MPSRTRVRSNSGMPPLDLSLRRTLAGESEWVLPSRSSQGKVEANILQLLRRYH